MIFLDFDGVLCDSLLECFVSSWIGYFEYYLKGFSIYRETDPKTGRAIEKETESKIVNEIGNETEKGKTLAVDAYTRFKELRPFIRRGADYLLLHKILADGLECTNQKEFDAILQETGESVSDGFHDIFYQVREDMLANDRKYWFDLNKLYPGIAEAMHSWAGNENFYILSTKKAEFIEEILGSKGISWPLERIIYSGKAVKGEIIIRYLENSGLSSAFFIEDQIDHLKKIQELGLDDRIETALADWGYIQNEWLRQQSVPVLSRPGFIEKVMQLMNHS